MFIVFHGVSDVPASLPTTLPLTAGMLGIQRIFHFAFSLAQPPDETLPQLLEKLEFRLMFLT